ncbi:MAG TPA: MFS transporter [Acidimicrobiia bacterium]
MTAGMSSPPSFTLRDRRVLFLMSLVTFVGGLAASTMSHTLVFVRTSLELSEGGMFTVFAITRAASLLGVVFAITADRLGRRKPFLLAFALLPVGNVATAILPGVVGFTISQSITRLAFVAVAALSVVILAEELNPGQRALGLGVPALAGSMGVGLGLLLLPVADRSPDSWRILFGLAAIGFFIVPLLNRFLPESRAYVQYATPVPFGKALAAGLDKHFWPLAAIAFFTAAFAAPAFDFVLERLIEDLEWGTGAARFLLIVFSGVGSVGLLVGGRLADSMGRRPTSVIALGLGLAGGIGFYTLDSGWLLAPAIFLATFGATMLTPSFAAHRSELFPTRVRGASAGWISNVAIIGAIGGFAVGASIVDRIGLSWTISLLGFGLVLSMGLVLKLPETRGMDLVRSRAGHEHASAPVSPPGSASAP